MPADLFSLAQLEKHGRSMARLHELDPRPRRDRLLDRLTDNERTLTGVYEKLSDGEYSRQSLSPAGIWILDNFYLIIEQIRIARNHLPRQYSRELPRLGTGASTGLPRIFDIVRELISHVDARVDEGNLGTIISSYQAVTPLTSGELWAIPIMLRLALIENLRRISERIEANRADYDLATSWAERLMARAAKDPKNIILDLADMVREKINLTCAFVAEFVRRLQHQYPAANLPLAWVEQRLSETGETIDGQIQQDNQHQASDQISVSNSISSLRVLQAINWKDFFESMSQVERILRKDPAGVYPRMDFATRDSYRHVIEKMAMRRKCPEEQVAEAAITLAAAHGGRDNRLSHVGSFLVDRERIYLEKAVRMRRTLPDMLVAAGRKAPLFFYLSPIILLTAALTSFLVWIIAPHDSGTMALLTILLVLATSQPSLALVNWTASFFIKPRVLPRMDFRGGIPEGSCTLVTVPAMLAGEPEIRQLLNKLEVCYLANQAPNLYFSLITDFKDAPEAHMDNDDALFRLARDGMVDLNRRYSGQDTGSFFFFHRDREWNPREKVWMGYERKRGKLEALNRALRGSKKPEILKVGDPERLASVKYVLTLDTDTELPREAARLLIETMAHPLNTPVYDGRRHRITRGYTILQPRVVSSLPAARQSRYARIFGQDFGIDPYTRAVSDVYQDLFHEGSFIGKGIYDVDMFMTTLEGRLPENRILSHDLLEGSYGRAGLASDIQVVEDFPASYSEDISRRHRWIRGDWQIASWLLPRVPGFQSRSQKNPVSMRSRWKIFDNLRRSIVPSGLLAIIIMSWFLLDPSWSGIAIAAGLILLPVLPDTFQKAFRIPSKYPLFLHALSSLESLGRHLMQAVFFFVTLPFEAFFNLDAIFRTVWRMLFTRRKLLEWTTSGEAKRRTCLRLKSYFRRMLVVPVMAAAITAFFLVSTRPVTIDMWVILGVWFMSPIFAWWTSRPISPKTVRLSENQTAYLRRISRKTWRFFETFVTAETNWLPPDNYQEEPREAVAQMTSPTNIGLMLLSSLGAYDQGYISAGLFIDRTEKSFRTLEKLDRLHGNFFNWYDVESLQALTPRYVSTVDSGNLAGYLYALRAGILDLRNRRVFPEKTWSGLLDTLGVLSDIVLRDAHARAGKTEGKTDVIKILRELQDALQKHETRPSGLCETLYDLNGYANRLLEALKPGGDGLSAEAQWWFQAFIQQCRNALEDLMFLAPWLSEFQDMEMPDNEHTRLLDANMTLDEVTTLHERIRKLHAGSGAGQPAGKEDLGLSGDFAARIIPKIKRARTHALERIKKLETLALQCGDFTRQEYDFLFDRKRHLLTIGYNADTHRRDDSFYDLLASEARLASFIGIATGKLPVEHWFTLGRLILLWKGKTVLLSWGGSMFEYLMPLLVLPGYPTTLLDQSARTVVDKQIAYGRTRGVPWGISESAENVTDANLKYQYRSFGVPDLGFKRGLADDLVIAPYATLLALMVFPEKACENMERLSALGFEGRYGFYEAIDYTPGRLSDEQDHALIRSFMAHHQGISFLALLNFLHEGIMQKRFVSDPLFEATVLLLQERVPKSAPYKAQPAEIERIKPVFEQKKDVLRIFDTPQTPAPEVHLLSNGRYHVMVTNAGGGYSRWRDLAVTRWNEDPTRDNQGTFVYIRDCANQSVWSSAFQPTCAQPKSYEAIFSQARAEYRRRDSGLDTYTEIAVSPEDDIEHRRISISNYSLRTRTVELTSYAEVVLMPPASEAVHPAFSNLFVQTHILAEQKAILCTRRPRSPDEAPPWMFHLLVVHENEECQVSYETDRRRFLGRGRTTADPAALEFEGKLSGTAGNVLDPIVSIRCRVDISPGETVTVGFIQGMAETKEAARNLVEKYLDRRLAGRVFAISRIHGKVALGQLGATEADAQLYGRLASGILYAGLASRANAAILLKNRKSQPGLWAYSISGDLPIVILKIGDESKLEMAAKLIQAHAYWRSKGIEVDLVIWNEDWSGYRQVLNDRLIGLVAAGNEATLFDKKGGIHIRYPDQMTEEDRVLMQSAARLVVADSAGSLAEQLQRSIAKENPVPKLTPVREQRPAEEEEHFPQDQLVFFNGWGGFTRDGREFVIQIKRGNPTPNPWINVLANKRFGTVVTQSGGYTWIDNAHEMRLTPWYNDPVTDSSGEALYVRDEATGAFWSPTPLPAAGTNDYLNRHGFGYSVFEYVQQDVKSELWIYVDVQAPVKYWMLKMRNDSQTSRRMTATILLETVLGDMRPKTLMHVRSEIDPASGVLCASNPYHVEFAPRVMFLACSEANRSVSGDRTEFLGRNGSLRNPAAMRSVRLSGRVGCGFDPALSMMVPFQLEPGQERDIIFIVGVGSDMNDARSCALRHRSTIAAYQARDRVWEFWKHTLGTINVETPDAALDMITNGWLVYQTMTSRLWARSGYYQSGGAFGFRDQLQDVTALLHAQPGLIREHLLLAASRQFSEGDVQHWWHPPGGRGVRTMISDDYLWLVYVTEYYVSHTGDTGVLQEKAPFLAGRVLAPGEESYYDLPVVSEERAPLYDHCKRALLRALRFGEHGLPLMGSGDWNDGMNLVGIKGRGESVWLGFFLFLVLRQFIPLAELCGDDEFAEKCARQTEQLRQALNSAAWDGEWYSRAFFDDGSTLGSHENDECRIDAIAQSWSVLSGAGDQEKIRQAMKSMEEKLIRPEEGLVLLLDPPFDTSRLEPGYIKGYVPGIRENGGQYTHAAIWAVMAFAALGEREKVSRLVSMINPVNHGSTPEKIKTYLVEPYVMAADIYSAHQHAGRGGWTWYTGSAAWMYRLIIESVLGLRLEAQTLKFKPCLPPEWERCTVHYRFRETVYHMYLHQHTPGDVKRVVLDGKEQANNVLLLTDDRVDHEVEIFIGDTT